MQIFISQSILHTFPDFGYASPKVIYNDSRPTRIGRYNPFYQLRFLQLKAVELPLRISTAFAICGCGLKAAVS